MKEKLAKISRHIDSLQEDAKLTNKNKPLQETLTNTSQILAQKQARINVLEKTIKSYEDLLGDINETIKELI